MAKLLGIDVGTSGCKVLLLDETGAVLKSASAEYPLLIPQPMWSEQRPEDWWTGVQQCLAQIGEPDVDAIGVTGQMHGSVFLDANGELVRPAILWNDQRTAEECEEIDRTVGAELVRSITRNPPLTGFQLPKILWLRNHELSLYQRVRKVLLPKDYIRYKLTGGFATDVSDASGTGIFDVGAREWSGSMMRALELDPALFPEAFESEALTGRTAEGIPVVAGGGDQAAAAVGTGAVEPGIVSVSLGTSGVVFTSIPEPNYDPSGATHTFCHANRGWHAMGVTLSCGGAVKWFRDTIAPGSPYDELATMAEQAKPGCEGLTFLPYLSGERCPHNDPNARGAFAGLTLSHGRPEMARALFEGVSFSLLEAMSALEALGASVEEIRVTSGGSKSAFWVQMLADMFGRPCTILESDEGPAYGAALLAGVGIGIWPDVQTACRTAIRKRLQVQPRPVDYRQTYQRYRDLYIATRPWN